MKKLTEIKNELDGTAKKLSELITMRDGININLKTLQNGFVGGKTPLDEVQAEQARLDTLNSSIQSLETKRTELQTTFENLSAVEARQATLEKLVTLGNETEPLINDYLETKSEFNEIVSQYAEKLIKKITAYRATQKEFHNAFRQLAPEIENLQWITLELRPLYSQIIDELEKLGLSVKSQELAIHSTFPQPLFEYSPSINLAEAILSYKLGQIEREKETARFNAARERNLVALEATRQRNLVALEATRQRIIQYRIDNELPPLSPQNLDIEAAEIQSRSAKA